LSQFDKYWIGLSLINGFGPIRIVNLIKYFKNPYNVWFANNSELKNVKGIGKLADSFSKQREKIDLEKEFRKLKENKIKVITIDQKEYPFLLKNIYAPPPLLFYKGNKNISNKSLAIVGSRKTSAYGRKYAEYFARKLSAKGLNIISGMARGIDTYSHYGALKGGGSTVAVLGSGLEYIYPPENARLYEEIIEKGTVISEFPIGVKPLPENFPRRNRIISGLSLGVIIIEAAEKSGSLITANYALEQGREVFALPGNIDRPGSIGTNKLIKEGAKLISEVSDIFEELDFQLHWQEINNNINKEPVLNNNELKIYNIIRDEGVIHINKIIKITNIKVSKVNTILLKLEMKDLISREPGKKYAFKGLQN